MPELTCRLAIRDRIAAEMSRDKRVVLLGETSGSGESSTRLPIRVIDMPISEMGFTAAAFGAAVRGIRPVMEIAKPIVGSVERTRRLVTVEEGPPPCGYSGEVISACVEDLGSIAARRITMPDLPIRFSPILGGLGTSNSARDRGSRARARDHHVVHGHRVNCSYEKGANA